MTTTLQNSLHSLGQLLRSWWQVDRIRIASPTGRLIQLAPGDRLLIGEQLFLVRTRSVIPCPVQTQADEKADEKSPLGVEYRLINLLDRAGDREACQSDKVVAGPDQDCRLQILLPNNGQASIHRLWIRGRVDELLEEEIVVLRAARLRPAGPLQRH